MVGQAKRLFAENTTVSIERSKAHIEQIISKYGGDRYGYYKDGDVVIIAFEIKEKNAQLRIPLTGDEREDRRRFRALFLITKAKLEYIELGFSSVEKEFLADIMIEGANGMTIGDHMVPQIENQKPVKNMLMLPSPHVRDDGIVDADFKVKD